jgi:hypothetical protein
MNPTIHGLTHKQKLIADLIWQCDSQAQVLALIRSLPSSHDRAQAQALMQIMVQEFMEEHLEDYEEQAREAVDRCR